MLGHACVLPAAAGADARRGVGTMPRDRPTPAPDLVLFDVRMRDRLAAVDGELVTNSRPGRGRA